MIANFLIRVGIAVDLLLIQKKWRTFISWGIISVLIILVYYRLTFHKKLFSLIAIA